MIFKGTFQQRIWALDDNGNYEADELLGSVYNNPHRYIVEDDEFFGLDGDVYLRFSYYVLDGKDKHPSSEASKIVTKVFNLLQPESNAAYVEEMNLIIKEHGSILVSFDYSHDKSGRFNRVIRWQKPSQRKEEEGIEPDKTVRPDKRKNRRKRAKQ